MTSEYYTCAKCGEPVHMHMYWCGNDGKKYHFNHLPQDRKEQLATEGVTSDNGGLLLGLLAATEEHGIDVVEEAAKKLMEVL